MNHHLRRTVVGALAAGTAAAALVVPFAAGNGGDASWTPVARGLTDDPARMLPATVSTAAPVSVVTTALDEAGRPVTTTRTATDRRAAERLIKDGQQTPGAVTVELDAPVYADAVPTGSDPMRGSQWDLDRIRTSAAWERSTGAGVTVAVIDSGVDATHPDLAGQVLPGIDLVDGTSGPSTDPNGHGTHVAGTIAALTGNGVGVAGVAPDAKILPVRALGADGSGMMSAVATGITWAADHGARVINMSLGSSAQVTAVTNAIAYARSRGVVVVASAGNSRASGSPVSYPAADPGVIAVASTDSADNVSTFSSRGSYVDVAAPGTGILSTLPGGQYAYYSGTSMASPHVAAVAALIGAGTAGLSPDQVQQALESSAADLGTAGKDPDFGYGRIDAAAALAVIPGTSAPATTPATTPTTTAPTTAAPQPTATTRPTATPKPTKTTPPPPVRVQPSITSDGVSRTVPYGTVVSTTFTVTADGLPFARRTASICLAEKGSATFKCRSATTSATGTVTVRRTATAPYRVYLTLPLTRTSEVATSETYAYAVQAVARMEKRSRTLYAVLNGTAGQSVQLQRLDGGAWTTVTTYRATTRYTVRKPTAGAEYRIVVPDTALIAGTVSDPLAM